jgi:NAD(P)H-dependent FMN reductase
MNVLTVCGSLRAESSNQALLQAYAQLAPAAWRFTHFNEVGALPHFNPDRDVEPLPPEIARWRQTVRDADLVVVSTPEYAHALPGAFKNALDWLVSDPAVAGKRVVILHAARGSTWALDSLREVLRTMSVQVIEPACVLLPLGTNRISATEILARENLRAVLSESLRHAAHRP